MSKDWIYYIYNDSQFDEYYFDKKCIIDTDIYKSNKNDDEYEKILKMKKFLRKKKVKILSNILWIWYQNI
jgi:hypothetical protein